MTWDWQHHYCWWFFWFVHKVSSLLQYSRCGSHTHRPWNKPNISQLFTCLTPSRTLWAQLWLAIQARFGWKAIVGSRREIWCHRGWRWHPSCTLKLEKNLNKTIFTVVLEAVDYFAENIAIIVQFYLSWAVENDKIVFTNKLVKFLLQPSHILQQVLHTIKQAAVWAQFQLLHHFLESYEVFYVHIAAIGVVFCCGVEIEDENISFESLGHLLHHLAIGGLNGSAFTLPDPAGPMTTCPK